MPRKCGRPAKNTNKQDSKQKIIDATIRLIKKSGADSVTVRNVCTEADSSIGTFYHYFRDKDDLLMYFIQEIPFKECELIKDLSHPADRIIELYMKLVNRYMDLGLDFMKSFYSTSNSSLSSYMSEVDGKFLDGTVMARCEDELKFSKEGGYIKNNADVHTMSVDICTIVKGCIFEWCLTDGKSDLEKSIDRIIHSYFLQYVSL